MPEAKTKFVSVEVDVGGGNTLWLDGNSKITADDGTFEEPVANAFSLPHISTCPGSTEACRSSCYVHGLEANAKETYAKYRHNERTIHKILARGGEDAASALAEHISRNCTRFRWHVSGDIFSAAYADWIDLVCSHTPDVKHWIYTRSFWALRVLANTHNLEVNLSADEHNWPEALKAAEMYGLRLCYMSRDGTFPEALVGRERASVIFPDYTLRARPPKKPQDSLWWRGLSKEARKLVCPADFIGQGEKSRCGPCKKCFAPEEKA